MRQYFARKSSIRDCPDVCRIGDFYELFL